MHFLLRILLLFSFSLYSGCQRESVLQELGVDQQQISSSYILKRLVVRKVPHSLNPLKYGNPSLGVIKDPSFKDLFIIEITDPLRNLVTDEYIYADAELVKSVGYIYDENNRIALAIICDQDNKVILRQTYIYTEEGDLWEIIEDQGMTLYNQSVAYTQRRPHELTKDTYIQGFLSSTKNYANSQLVEEKDYVYRDGYLFEKISRNYLENSEIFAFFDKNQKLIEQMYFSQEDFLETQKYTYNDQGLVSQRTIESAEGKIRSEIFSYDEEKEVRKKIVYSDGVLSYIQTYASPEDYTIEYYAFGIVRMKEIYKKNELVDKQVIQKLDESLLTQEYDDGWEGYEEF